MESIDPNLDLVLKREVDVPVELVWQAWTEPKHVVEWFTPAPWKTTDCRINLVPGGEFFTNMLSPDGQSMPNLGCFLEVIPFQRLVFTDTLLPGYRPSANPFMTAIILFEKKGNGTLYTAIAKHKDSETKSQHESMGFTDGWGTALDQLVTYAKKNLM
ncbi:SRPBCC family protein [Leptospira sp. 96542]|nr:SRPBCC family protein [Leptospira sp. 96542]